MPKGSMQLSPPQSSSIERIQTGVLNKQLVKILKAIAEYFDLSLGTLIELMAIENLAGRAAFSDAMRARIAPILALYDLTLPEELASLLADRDPLSPDALDAPATPPAST